MENIYTKENWAQDGYLKVKVGQYVADDVIEELRDSVPPATYKSSCFQPGEAYTLSIDYEDLYMTFIIDNGMWKYIGLCPKGSIHPQPEIDYSTLNESRQGLKSKKLFDIVKSHGGFAEKTPSFYLHDITDEDVIGVVEGAELDFLKKSFLDKRIQWAQKQGYIVNKGDNVEVIPLKDFTWIAIIERGGNLGNKDYLHTKIGNLKNNRYKNTLNRGDRQYQWSDTGKWGSPRAEEFYMRRAQNDIANQRRQRYGDDAVYKINEHILSGLDKFATTSDIRRFTDSVIKKLYRVSQPYTSHRFRDDDWRSLRSFVNILREVYGVKELNLSGTGPYKQSQEGTYKEYLVDIETTLGSKIGGFIRCHFCGSQDDPWSVYDMTVNFYRDNENNNNEINENNMSKIVLKEEELMTLINESVTRIINESIQNGDLDEGFWGNIGQGIKGAFGGDASRVASAVRTGVDKAKNMGQNAYNTVKNAGQKVAGAAKDAYGAVQTGVNQRVNAFKANYAAGQNADKINNVISTLRELQQNGVISGAKTNATINELERLLQMGMRGMRGRATQASNRIGKEE